MGNENTHEVMEEPEQGSTGNFNCSLSGSSNHESRESGNRTFVLPRGRGRLNPNWDGRNLRFESPRGRGRRIPVRTIEQAYEPDEEPHDNNAVRQVFMHTDGSLYYSELVRLDNKPFESPRGRGRNNPGWGRVDGRPFVSQRGRRRNHHSDDHSTPSAPDFNSFGDEYIAPTTPDYENIMDVE
ncbi:hypothetical protein Bhyg_05691 [Pseudolycoriella hygida]|uniref:Uncharacterized protein n=1 Tax=Pseudolycoriella hygida TaxID=35572 RepID=A0A9Q0MZB8_9DIPT|nr:hypothetical protein Bhyg_05691 [Pseudolycoriella hygida]